MVNQRGGVMTMRLQPPELGQLRVQMSINQGTVVAQFTATTEHAQMLLDRNMAVLRTALQNHGLTVEKLAVQFAPLDQGSASRHAGGEQNDSQQNQHDAGDGRSRGREDGRAFEGRHGRESMADFTDDLGAFAGAGFAFSDSSPDEGELS